MKQNPYQPPTTSGEVPAGNPSLVESLNSARKARRRWALWCWSLGCAAIIGGVIEFVVAHLLGRAPISSMIVLILNASAIATTLLGIAILLLGPISWYWFRSPKKQELP